MASKAHETDEQPYEAHVLIPDNRELSSQALNSGTAEQQQRTLMRERTLQATRLLSTMRCSITMTDG
ncbi:hypothetical protein SARC_13040, partial [Sphaeroforma arctica JP610]